MDKGTAALKQTSLANERRLEQLSSLIRDLADDATRAIIEIGQYLTEAKEILEHGEWAPWLKREFRWSHDTATNYMATFKAFGGSVGEGSKLRNFRNLDINVSTLYAMAKAPEPVRQTLVHRAILGQPVTIAVVKEEVAKAKPQVVEIPKSEAQMAAEEEQCRIQGIPYDIGNLEKAVEEILRVILQGWEFDTTGPTTHEEYAKEWALRGKESRAKLKAASDNLARLSELVEKYGNNTEPIRRA